MELEKNILCTLLICYLHLKFEITKAEESCQLPSYEQGVCVPFNQCKFITDLFEKYQDRIPSHHISYITRSKCSKDTEPIRICCKPEEVEQIAALVEPALLKTVGKFVEDTDYNRDFVSQLNTEGLNILNNLTCGDSNSNRVLGGEETNLNEFPWMALLRYDSPSNEFKCGGSLITNFYVLTAAHCAKTPDPIKYLLLSIGVRLGEHDLSNDVDCEQRGTKEFCAPPVENFGVERIIIHPKYTVRSTSNDVALVKLDRKVEFKAHIKPICLPATQRSMEVNINEKIFVAGWGATEAGSQSSLLLKAFVQRYNHSVCGNAFKIVLSEKQLCAGDIENGHDTCKGDSGGPLFQLNAYKRFKKFIQYGIVAAGGTACDFRYLLPSIFTNIVTFMPWITEHIV